MPKLPQIPNVEQRELNPLSTVAMPERGAGPIEYLVADSVMPEEVDSLERQIADWKAKLSGTQPREQQLVGAINVTHETGDAAYQESYILGPEQIVASVAMGAAASLYFNRLVARSNSVLEEPSKLKNTDDLLGLIHCAGEIDGLLTFANGKPGYQYRQANHAGVLRWDNNGDPSALLDIATAIYTADAEGFQGVADAAAKLKDRPLEGLFGSLMTLKVTALMGEKIPDLTDDQKALRRKGTVARLLVTADAHGRSAGKVLESRLVGEVLGRLENADAKHLPDLRMTAEYLRAIKDTDDANKVKPENVTLAMIGLLKHTLAETPGTIAAKFKEIIDTKASDGRRHDVSWHTQVNKAGIAAAMALNKYSPDSTEKHRLDLRTAADMYDAVEYVLEAVAVERSNNGGTEPAAAAVSERIRIAQNCMTALRQLRNDRVVARAAKTASGEDPPPRRGMSFSAQAARLKRPGHGKLS